MVPGQPLSVIYSKTSLKELDSIWLWSAKKYGADHARGYIDELQAGISKLSIHYNLGKVVNRNPKFRYITIKRRPKADGHVIVYRVAPSTIRIVHIFHTKRNWRSLL